jgi:PKD repeat protein
MGHTQASFQEAPYLKHLLGGLEVAAGAVDDADCGDVGGNHAPTVTAQRNPSGDVSPGDPVAFTAQGTDADGDTLTYEWDFGDGATSVGASPSHRYQHDGSYEVTLTLATYDGRVVRRKRDVRVSAR